MASDDAGQDKDLQRRQQIEQIRRRAEEAELKRIEEEERKAEESARGSAPAVPPSPPPPPPEPAVSPVEQQIATLVQRIDIALDRGLADKADPLLAELRTLPVDPVALAALESRRTALTPPAPAARPAKHAPEGKQKEEGRGRRENPKRRCAELLEKANDEYQHEHYDRAHATIEEILGIDPDHVDALALREAVEKASRLAEELRLEEERHAAEASKLKSAAPAPPPPTVKAEGDPWGDKPLTSGTQTVFEDPVEHKQKIQVQKPALLDQVTEKVARVRIPVKALVTGAVGLALVIAAWLIIDAIRTTVFPPRASLLVFPATGAVIDGSQDYLTEGLTEGLIREFTRMEDMHLIAPSTALRYLDPRMHTRRTAVVHGAGFFVTWTVSVQGEDITVQLSLHDTVETRPRWSTRLTRSLREVPAMQQELALAILDQMGVETPEELRARFRGRGPAVPEALMTAMRARYLLRHHEAGMTDAAVTEFDRARQMDSTAAETWSGLGLAHLRVYEEERDTAGGHLTAALRCVQEAVRRDPASAEASMVWALLHHYRGDDQRAVARMEEARQLAPSDALIQRELAVLYCAVGRGDDAAAAADLARRLDPFSEATASVAGLVRSYLGGFDGGSQAEAMAEYRAALGHFAAGARLARDRSEYAARFQAETYVYLQMPDSALAILTDRVAAARESYLDHYRLARVMQSAGKPVPQWQGALHRAQELIEAVLAATPGDPAALATLSLVRTRLGEFKSAAQANEAARTAAPLDHVVLYATARMYALQQNRDQALEVLRRAVEVRYDLAEILDMDFYTLRSDPGFLSAVTR